MASSALRMSPQRTQMLIDYILSIVSVSETPTILPDAPGKRTGRNRVRSDIARFELNIRCVTSGVSSLCEQQAGPQYSFSSLLCSIKLPTLVSLIFSLTESFSSHLSTEKGTAKTTAEIPFPRCLSLYCAY